MKKLSLVIIAIIGLSFQSNAQVEVTTAPLGLLTNTFALSADFYLSPDWSIGGDIKSRNFLGDKNGVFYANAKHYFNPFGEAKRYYVGVFAGAHNHRTWSFFDNANQQITDFGGGFMGGYKLVSRKNIVLDVAAGFGRAVDRQSSNNQSNSNQYSLNLMPYWKLNLGYQIGLPKAEGATSEVKTF